MAVALCSLGSTGLAGAAQAAQATGLCIAATGSSGWCGDGRAATKAKLALPRDVAPLPGGGFLVADSVNHVIRRVGANGRIATVAGRGVAGDPLLGRPAARSHLGTPSSVAALPGGGYLIADAALARVLRVTADGMLLAATGGPDARALGDGGPAVDARLDSPRDVVVMPDGGYAIADGGDHRVRRVLPDGTIHTLAGTGGAGYSGDGGPAAAARLSQPTGLAVALDGGLLVADRGNARIRRIAPDGTISTVAGGPAPTLGGRLTLPAAVAATADGGLLVAEPAVIRRIAPDGSATIVAGTGEAGFSAVGAPPTAVALAGPAGIAALPGGRALIADTLNDRVRLLDLVVPGIATVAGLGVPGPPGTPEPVPGDVLDAPAAPSLRAPLTTPVEDVRGAPSGFGAPIRTSAPGRCAPPDAREPRTFTDLRILPYNSASLTSGPKLRFRVALNRNARLLVRVVAGRRVVASRSVKVKASGGRRVALKGRLRPGSYRLTLRARSDADGSLRCDAQRLRVKRR